MNTVTRHGRPRNYIGRLRNFNDLPDDVQKGFQLIKKTIFEQNNDIKNCYVFGSYYWGFSDNESDYDLIVDSGTSVNVGLLRQTLFPILNKKIDIQYSQKNKEIPIP